MSSIARKLCDEIVQPNDLNSNDHKFNDHNSYCQKSYPGVCSSHYKSASRPSISSNRSKFSGRPTRTIVIEKEKEINKIIPQGPNNKPVSINKFKSRETLLKKNYVEIGSNTEVSGPLRCDTDCITAVRTREKCCPNRGTQIQRYTPKHQRSNPKCVTGTKQIQTADLKSYCLKNNKACTHCVETASFGTLTPFGMISENTTPRSSCYRDHDTQSQLSDPIPRTHTRGMRLSFVEPDDRFHQPRLSYTKPRKSSLDSHQQESCHGKEYGYDKEYRYGSTDVTRKNPDLYASSYTKTTFGSYNRWAIAQYPVRGPDF